MTFLIDHPDEWIGVPESWPYPAPGGGQYTVAQDWVTALADDVTEREELEPEIRARVTEVLMMAVERALTAGSRTFVLFEGWDGPAYIVEAIVRPRAIVGTASLQEHLGVEDPQQLGAPFAEEFRADSGLLGARCYRYLPLDEHGVLFGRVDYGFLDDDEVLTLTGVEVDLVYFERLKGYLEALARTVSIPETA